jgi:hypothetical protein
VFGLDTFKHLLPRARAWSLTRDKTLRSFFEGLSGAPISARDFIDKIYEDRDPQLTRELSAYEQQFALAASILTTTQRRDRLAAAWSAQGGQSPKYIQDTLQAAGFDVYVHEWWVPSVAHPVGGSVNNDVAPVARNPFTYINDGTAGLKFLLYDGGADAMDGGADAMDGATNAPPGYLLVNKIVFPYEDSASDGYSGMNDGAEMAQDNRVYRSYPSKNYVIPADTTKYPYFIYIGASTFPDQAIIPNSRRSEFEALCLKICPTEQWLGILVNYS